MIPDLGSYGQIIVMFSGGKDSLASLLHVRDLLGQQRLTNKVAIELWHHLVDGREGSNLMDWPCTEPYCKAVANALGYPLYFSWLEGGFEREMNRRESLKAPTWFETPTGRQKAGGASGKPGTRLKFPQVSADLKVRWCSAYLKINVADMSLRNQPRFTGSRTLVVTGERAQESPNRAKYSGFEPHRSHSQRRHIDHWRPVHQWTETQVWEIIQRHRINPHPAYRLGWGRLSCARCIFGDDSQWASANVVDPQAVERISGYETQFGLTIHRSRPVADRIKTGSPYSMRESDITAARSTEFNEPVFVENWTLPVGAFRHTTGPT